MKKIISFFILILPVLCNAFPQKAPERAALMDTGYDLCIRYSGTSCENNQNILFRGDQPLDDNNNYQYNADELRNLVFSYLQEFKKTYDTKASLPQSLQDLKNYRIVIINLLYDGTNKGGDPEFTELTKEFQYSGSAKQLSIPQQHLMYGLNNSFDPAQFAFEWWPITLLGKTDIENNLNWPNQDKVPVLRSDQFYQPMNYPYLVSGVSYQNQSEHDAADLKTLLLMQPTDGHPLLIFYHCVAGKDRTGYVTMGYFMQHGGYSNVVRQNLPRELRFTRNNPLTFSQALQATTNQNYPQPKKESLIAAHAYCLTLNKAKKECDMPQIK